METKKLYNSYKSEKNFNTSYTKKYIARDNDGKLYEFPWYPKMTATDKPHKHISAFPFDGNHYYQGTDYQPKKGKEIDSSLYPEVTYDNSPVLIDEDE